MNDTELRIISELLLPIKPEKETVVADIVHQYFHDGLNILDEDVYPFFSNIKHEWISTGTIPNELLSIIDIAYSHSYPELAEYAKNAYKELFSLIDKRLKYSFQEKIIFFSYIPLLYTLCTEFNMSASKITKTLISIDTRLVRFSWKEVKQCLNEFGLRVSLNIDAVKELTINDSKKESEVFGDSDITDACDIVQNIAQNLGVETDIKAALLCLTRAEPFFWPYIQMLHFQTIISNYYNHLLSNLYEFSPRGNVPGWVFEQYNSYTSTGNPFLNNAKAFDTIDSNWANSRDTNIDQAFALVSILESLDNLNYASSKELSGYIRKWVHRVLLLNTVPNKVIKIQNIEEIKKITNSVIRTETHTQGIIEQRLMDYFCLLMHDAEDGWRPRGIKDSINANNLSRKKFGDIDFQNHNLLKIVAYEIHAGTITQNYVVGHHRSLQRILELKKDELEAIDSLDKWNIEVIYIAHSKNNVIDHSYTVDGIQIVYKFITFTEYIDKVKKHNIRLFKEIFEDAINSNRTPLYVREKVISIM